MTSLDKPHYLLFSESGVGKRGTKSSGLARPGSWRFQLESIDGRATFSAMDEETGMSGERLELLAVVRGLEALDQPSQVTLVTNSRYVSHGLRFGLAGWRESSWEWEHFGRRTPVANADLWQRIDRALAIHRVRCRSWRLAARSSTQPQAAGKLPIWDWIWRKVCRGFIWRPQRRPHPPVLCPQ